MTASPEPTRRSDARRNRLRIIEVAAEALAEDPDVAVSSITRAAGVGQGTFYRHFADREALVWAVYEREVERLVASARVLLAQHPPDAALRSWMDDLARFAATKAEVAAAMRRPVDPTSETARPGYRAVVDCIEEMLAANRAAGTVRPDVTVDDFLLVVAGIWQIGTDDWQARSARLLDIAMAGLRVSPS